MKAAGLLLALGLCLQGCRGTVPSPSDRTAQGLAAVLIGGRVILPSGETKSGTMVLNLEGVSQGGGQKINYRLPINLKRPVLFQIEPGVYHLSPTRSALGFSREALDIRVEKTDYRAPFPKDILRRQAMTIKPGKIVSLGILEARLISPLPGQDPTVKIRLDDDAPARRKLVEEAIKTMMDPSAPQDERDHAVNWSRALQNSLIELEAENQKFAPTNK